ncbi:glycine zipper 2TM domain-containing protein [Sphingomonas aracearum]|uniref:Glycine zipper 2TM domain-containing protein n=1 Tax=Sphingomonas aracearum TaxID=2283317 RepID=A0A369W058_9SPHN|nr:glycine zipper 2TM domain-containing protein [Sphingomonas aracearum]RDE06692.1 glycine zipper 2TM domain-containing protein [Sphingomonas aracearum]
MKKQLMAAMLAVTVAAPVIEAPAMAQSGDRDYRWNGDRDNRNWDPSRSYRENSRVRERRLSSNDRVYRGSNGRYYCKRNDGTTGLVIGALGGGVLGNVLGGGTLGTLLGAGGGALAGRAIDRDGNNARDRNGNRNIRCR